MLTDPPEPADPDPLRIVTEPPDGPEPPNNTASPPRDPASDDDVSPERRLTLPPTRDAPVPAETEIDPDGPSALSPVAITIAPEDVDEDEPLCIWICPLS